MPASRRPAPAWEPSQPLRPGFTSTEVMQRYLELDTSGEPFFFGAVDGIVKEAFAAGQAQRLQEICAWLREGALPWSGPAAGYAEQLAAHFAEPETPKP